MPVDRDDPPFPHSRKTIMVRRTFNLIVETLESRDVPSSIIQPTSSSADYLGIEKTHFSSLDSKVQEGQADSFVDLFELNTNPVNTIAVAPGVLVQDAGFDSPVGIQSAIVITPDSNVPVRDAGLDSLVGALAGIGITPDSTVPVKDAGFDSPVVVQVEIVIATDFITPVQDAGFDSPVGVQPEIAISPDSTMPVLDAGPDSPVVPVKV